MKAIIFDLDGTLVDSFADIASAANHVLIAKGLSPLSIEEVKPHVGRGLENLLRGLLPSASEIQLAEAVAQVKTYYRDHPVEKSRPYPGVLKLLDRLGSLGHFRALLSNKAHSITLRIAEILELSPRLEAVWGHKEDYPLKPDPTSLLQILEAARLSPEDCIVVGDAAPDVEVARKAGAQFCGVTWGLTARDRWNLQLKDWLIDRPEELISLIHAANASEKKR